MKFRRADYIPGKPGQGERNRQQDDKHQAPELSLSPAKLIEARADAASCSLAGSNFRIAAIPLFGFHVG